MDKFFVVLMFIPIIAFHEFAHAWVAHLLGDDTAKDEGRMTLNPVSHFDPIGTLLVPAIGLLLNPSGYGLIGWGRAIPYNSGNLSNYRRDSILIALAGPFANFVLAFAALLLAKILIVSHLMDSDMSNLISMFAIVSIFLGVFNFLPCPPLDGWKIMCNIFRLSAEFEYAQGIWLYLGFLLLINLPPVMGSINLGTMTILSLMHSIIGS